MITLTWNTRHTYISDFHELCTKNLGNKVSHKNANEHSIYSVSKLFEFRPVNAGSTASRQTAFILKLKTRFEAQYTVIKSYTVTVSENGSLCYNDGLKEFIQLSAVEQTRPVPAPSGQGIFTPGFLTLVRNLWPSLAIKNRHVAESIWQRQKQERTPQAAA